MAKLINTSKRVLSFQGGGFGPKKRGVTLEPKTEAVETGDELDRRLAQDKIFLAAVKAGDVVDVLGTFMPKPAPAAVEAAPAAKPTKAPKARKSEFVPPAPALDAVETVLAFVASCNDVEVLRGLFESDPRDDVRAAINARGAALLAVKE